MNIGDAVYCPSNEQVYAIVGYDSGDCKLLQLKNLTNPSSFIVTMKRSQVMDYPTSWKNYEHYSAMAKNIVDKRSQI